MNKGLPLLAVLIAGIGLCNASVVPPQAGRFNFVVPKTGKSIEVFSYFPEKANIHTPVVLVLTGLNRNAATYRDAWIENASKNNLIVIVPRFSREDYPGAKAYNLGNMVNRQSHKPNPPEQWSFSAIEALFSYLQKQGVTEQQSYYLFGNSAGCQFVHRMLTFLPEAKVKAAICAAAGWWTLPDAQNRWPYGLQHAPVKVSKQQLAVFFAKPLLITVGEQDNDPYHSLLRRSYQAMAQGQNRLMRAQNYYLTGKQKATRDKVAFNWSFTILPGIAHSGTKMSAYGAQQFAWFEQHGKFKPQP